MVGCLAVELWCTLNKRRLVVGGRWIVVMFTDLGVEMTEVGVGGWLWKAVT